MRRFANLLALCAVLATAVPAFAVQPDEILPNAAQEARARTLSRELRCLVCQNQSIDDSNAPLAHDLRVIVRERIAAGDTDTQVIDFVVARYGEFVLLKPRFELQTMVLWLLPPLVLLLGGSGMMLAVWRRRKASETAVSYIVPLSEAEATKLATLIGEQSR